MPRQERYRQGAGRDDAQAREAQLVEISNRARVAESENERLRRIIADMERAAQPAIDAQLQRANAIINDLRKRNTQMDTHIKQLAMELVEAQAYSTKPDAHPGSTILTMLTDVNSAIFNMATNIVDFYEAAEKCNSADVGTGRPEEYERYRRITKEAIGAGLYSATCQIDEALGYVDPVTPDDTLPHQLALQKILGRWCVEELQAFNRIPGDGLGEQLQKVYQSIRDQGQCFITQYTS